MGMLVIRVPGFSISTPLNKLILLLRFVFLQLYNLCLINGVNRESSVLNQMPFFVKNIQPISIVHIIYFLISSFSLK